MFISHQPFTQGLLVTSVFYTKKEIKLFLLKQILCHHPAPIHTCARSPTPRHPPPPAPARQHTHSLLFEISASHRAPLENCPGSSKSGLLTRLLASVAASSNNPRVSGLPPRGSRDHCCQQPQDAGLPALSFSQLHWGPEAVVSRRPTGLMGTQFFIFSLESLCLHSAETHISLV